jgi:hypothetical protein
MTSRASKWGMLSRDRKLTVAEDVRLQDSIHRYDFPGIIVSLPILKNVLTEGSEP